jgi:hypothetical protein
MSFIKYIIAFLTISLVILIRLLQSKEGDVFLTRIGSGSSSEQIPKETKYLQNPIIETRPSEVITTKSPTTTFESVIANKSEEKEIDDDETPNPEEEESDDVYDEYTNNVWEKTEDDPLSRVPEKDLVIKHDNKPKIEESKHAIDGRKHEATSSPTESVETNEAYLFTNYSMDQDEKVPNFYNDQFDTYDCHLRHNSLGSHPKFMVIGVHKGGSTALYNYLSKHGRIRPAVCKEIHFFDVDAEFARGKAYYLRHFPDVSMWKSKVITGEGTPDYIRLPRVPPRVKSLFPDVKLILTLREPGTRFMSHWVGKKQQHKTYLASMSCEEAWNNSMSVWHACMTAHNLDFCEKELHEDPVVRGIYAPQIDHWLRFFPPNQLLIIQAESMFHDRNATMQKSVKFLEIRPYNREELDSLYTAYTGSSHHEAPLMKECEHLQPRMDEFYSQFNLRLKTLLKSTFPHVLDDWVAGWSGMKDE